MSIYERPDLKPSYTSKFIRVGDVIAVTDPNDVATAHKSLAETDGLLEKLRILRGKEPDEVDGGTVTFDNSFPQDPVIILDGTSSTLWIPIDEKARQKTIKVFSKKTPGYSVENHYEFDEKRE